MTTLSIILSLFLCMTTFLQSEEKTIYRLTNDPIDVVIVSHAKDKNTLDLCIEGIKENCAQIRRIIVVSAKKLSKNAEWFNEKNFPFSLDDIALEIGRGDQATADKIFKGRTRKPGWYYQQLLKLYAPFIIPRISSNVLVIDADTIFLNPVTFLNPSHGGLFCVNHHPPMAHYFAHAERLVPDYKRIYPEVYSVCHHMLFQKPILKDLFKTVENHHQMEFWKAFCRCVSLEGRKGASEYEIYYNFALKHTGQVELRELQWVNSGEPNRMNEYKAIGYHFVAFHTYMRIDNKN